MKQKMVEFIQIRVTGPEKSKLKALAQIYASGNLSMYILGQALLAPRKYYVPPTHNSKLKRP